MQFHVEVQLELKDGRITTDNVIQSPAMHTH